MRYLGGLLIILGAVILVSRLDLAGLSWWVLLWGALATVGGVKIARGFFRPGADGMFWGTMFLGVGLAKLLTGAGVLWIEGDLVLPLLVTLAGVGLVLKFAASPKDWHLAVLAIGILGIGSALTLATLGILEGREILSSLPIWGPAVLMMFGAALLLKSRGSS
jgi:hypothetical protein